MEEIILTTEEIEQIRHEAYIQGIKDNQGKREKVKEYLEYKNKIKEVHSELKDLYGTFYFNFYKKLNNKLSSQFLTRGLYLCSYMDYDNRLVTRSFTNRKIPIYEKDLENILKLGRSETYKTKNILISSGLLISNEDKALSINPKLCKKGILENRKSEEIRMFDEAIKELYEKAKPKEHKKLSLLFDLLPMINFQFNIVCKNPDEEIMEYIKPYDLKELSNILGKTNITYFKNDLLKLTVNNEPVCCINETKFGKFITINPRVYYKGGELENIKYLEGLFLIKNK